MSHSYYFREKHGIRWFWHRGDRSCVSIEFYWWTHFCHAELRTNDQKWTLALALPPLAIWISVDGFGLWHPQYSTVATWRNNETIWLPDQRETGVSIHDWTIRWTPWGRSMEWRASDPWWVRGVCFDIVDFVFGRMRYVTEDIKTDIPLLIPMPEGTYKAVAKISRNTWKRPRWFARTRIYTDVQIPKGIPFAGKGENSWDCEDDGLFGYSSEGESLEKAIAKGVDSVLKSRRKYGQASDATIAEALA
jgi:hypothetical protein